jgi:hypothetical protein
LISTFEHIDADWLLAKRLVLSQTILKSAISCLRLGMGLFSLRLLVEQFEPLEPEYGECRALLQRLEGNGSQVVPALNKNESDKKGSG